MLRLASRGLLRAQARRGINTSAAWLQETEEKSKEVRALNTLVMCGATLMVDIIHPNCILHHFPYL